MKRTPLLASLVPSLLLALLAVPTAAHAGKIGDTLLHPVRTLFKNIAAKKQDRVFHEKGVAYHATFRDFTGVDRTAVVRLSRGRPSAPGKAEILGVAIKVKEPTGDQDFLMVTAAGTTGWKSTLLGLRTRVHFADQPVSSLLPFRDRFGQRGQITAYMPHDLTTPVDASGAGAGKQTLSLTLRDGGIRGAFNRALISVISGGWTNGVSPLGQVTIDMDHPLSAEESATLKFTPFNTSLGYKPAGFLNWIRSAAYKGSQAGRGVGDSTDK